MKVTIEVMPITHSDLSSYRLFAALHALAWKIHKLGTAREADGITLEIRGRDLVRVKVSG